MSLGSYNTVPTGTSATLIIAANPERKGVIVYNYSAVNVFVGPDANVTVSNGIPLLPRANVDWIGLDSSYRGAIYAVATSGTADVRYWEWNY